MYLEIANAITTNERFHDDIARLQQVHHRRLLLSEDTADLAEDLVVRLAESAALLALTQDDRARYLSYRIATLLPQLKEAEQSNGFRSATKLILSRLGHFPAATFLEERFGQQYLPTTLLWEYDSKRLMHEVITSSGQTFTLTDFQLALWKQLESGGSVAAAAPTSAGKSFILKAYLQEMLATRDKAAVAIIVPTRALIYQTAHDISQSLGSERRSIQIRTTPIEPTRELGDKFVLIYTQERLSLHLASHPDSRFDAVIVDEAQMLAEPRRGVLLANVIRECIRRDRDVQVFYAMPNISNPDVANGIASAERFRAMHTALPAVTQNIFLVERKKGHPKTLQVFLRDDNATLDLIGDIELDEAPTRKPDRLAVSVQRLGQTGANLVYADGPDQAEKIAKAIASQRLASDDPHRLALSNFVADAIHKDYCLVGLLKRGVGLHYGHIPSHVRQSIEAAFSGGSIDTIATTSTLLYGVNLPARNLFLMSPHRGKQGPLPTGDFWNLAGRAGRLGKEFEGNVFLVDYKKWDSTPLSEPKEYELKPMILALVSESPETIRDFIAAKGAGFERDKRRLSYESVTVQLEDALRRESLQSEFKQLGLDPQSTVALEIEAALKERVSESTVTPEVLRLSPTIPSWNQDALLHRLREAVRAGKESQYVLLSPAKSEAYAVLSNAFRVSTELLEGADNQSYIFLTMLAYRWMKGNSLQTIIDKQHKYLVEEGRVKSSEIDKTIRLVLSDIEEELRFRAVRLIGCYMALLKLAFRLESRPEPVMPPIPTFLEIGLYLPHELDLASIGLSRYAVRKLAPAYARTDEAPLAWLRSVPLEDPKLSSYVRSEIENLI